ncbi:DsbA family protein [Candidatus Parcubacteria bacterium]|nr:DsbA family protein [Patescibacteria group bacterium]MBU4309264.1 DsbA family protein [Patescibacteria group bacterium]MBU4432493.1 DsbA family protein [Patescibacteria group bacterium]MBU4577625.1 DsbA family protein [Patescibacteria group bacterium]MCG2697311.1 DsbA family protein [Candidatus Parcubacteria bacterium]
MKKLNIINILAIACIILVIIVGGLYFFNSRNSKKPADVHIVNDEAQKNKDSNKDAIDKANKMSVKTVRPIDENDHRKGELEAPVQVIVYSDFECPFCLKFVNSLKQVEETFGNKVVIAFRHYPLLSHTDAIPAAVAAECAGEQGKFWEMHDQLFQDSQDNALSITNYKQNAKELGLDQVKFNECLDTEKYKKAITLSQLEAKEFGVNGTPASFINGEPVPGAIPFEDFTDSSGESRKGLRSLIEEKLKK